MNSDFQTEEKTFSLVPKETVVLAAILSITVHILDGFISGLFFFGGGVTSALGFAWLRKSISALLSTQKSGILKKGLAIYLLRFLLICSIFLIIILISPGRLLAFSAGFSVIILVILFEAIKTIRQMKKWKN